MFCIYAEVRVLGGNVGEASGILILLILFMNLLSILAALGDRYYDLLEECQSIHMEDTTSTAVKDTAAEYLFFQIFPDFFRFFQIFSDFCRFFQIFSDFFRFFQDFFKIFTDFSNCANPGFYRFFKLPIRIKKKEKKKRRKKKKREEKKRRKHQFNHHI